MKILIRNRAQCLDCNAILESRFTHDFVSCNCGNFVDGGLSYQRSGGNVKDMSVYSDCDFSIIRENLFRGSHGINGDKPLTYALLKDVDNDWLDSIIRYEKEFRPNNPYLEFYLQEKEYRKNGT